MDEWIDRMRDPVGRGCARIRIGRGSYASVFSLRTQEGETVAAKWHASSPDAERQFAREIACLAAIDHPNVVRMLGWGRLRGRGVVFLEVMAGGDLLDWIDAIQPTESVARGVLAQTASGLKAIHAANFVHRDLKVENVLVSALALAPVAKIADLGMSRRGASDPLADQTPCGSLEYCAPEMLRCEAYDERVDVWSYGVVAYAVLTGKVPFGGCGSRGPRAVIESVLRDDVGWSDEATPSREAKAFVESCLARDPARRPSAARVAAAEWLGARDPDG